MKRNIVAVCLVWTSLTVVSFFWNYTNLRSEQHRLALQSARSLFQQIVLFRLWNANHGGVYAPATADTKPNPYLDVPMRDIRVNSTLTLTMINPAYMTRQVSELAARMNDIRFHITSLKPIRPENQATDIEKLFLAEFESGVSEKGMIIQNGSKASFFYMAPLRTDNTCLKCHQKQGYRAGDIRGGISITLPYLPSIPLFILTAGHFAVLIAGVLGIFFSGIKLTHAYELIKRQAVFDALTGIPNRRSFSERILTEFSRSHRDGSQLSLIMIDIDNFKLYNDTYGHGKGDECLMTVAKVIDNSLRRPADFCARYGGEEFIIILPGTDKNGAISVAENIRINIEALEIPHERSIPAGRVTISLGTATLETRETRSYETLLKMADDALYIAKSRGRNRVEAFT